MKKLYIDSPFDFSIRKANILLFVSQLCLTSSLFISTIAYSKTLKEVDPSVYNFDVLFTNPTCATYHYPKNGVKTNSGKVIYKKPQNAYCSHRDIKMTGKRDGSNPKIGFNESPQHRLLKLINDKNTRDIFMTYLSFSDGVVADALCQNLKNKKIRLSLVLDKKNEDGSIDRILKKNYLKIGEVLNSKTRSRSLTLYNKDKKALLSSIKKLLIVSDSRRSTNQNKKLKTFTNKYLKLATKSEYLESELCAKQRKNSKIKNIFVKRMLKKRGIGWSHTKIFMINPTNKKKITLAFSSANMSSGTTIHHENWNFVTASPYSYFIQSHLCLKDAELNHSDSKKNFASFMKSCRQKIRDINGKKMTSESDIKAFFVPGDGEEAIAYISKSIKKSDAIDFAAHRFTLQILKENLLNATKAGSKVRMVFDDDIYLVGTNRLAEGLQVPNMRSEFYNVKTILSGRLNSSLKKGDNVEARYMETNHFQHTLHHNKYLIFHFKNEQSAVFTGAGNFTKAAFMMKSSSTNLEDYYYITIPEVVNAYKRQYQYVWTKLASKYSDLPIKDIEAK